MEKITVFNNIWNTDQPQYVELLEVTGRIKAGNSKDVIEAIRAEWEDKDKRNKLKQSLPSICFSGKFSERDDKKLLKHSGLICLDIDAINLKDIPAVRAVLEAWQNCFILFVSPGGAGLKMLVKIKPNQDTHLAQFLALELDLNLLLKPFISTQKNEKTLRGEKVKKDETQGDYLSVCIDPSGKNVSRVCYESFDADLYENFEAPTYLTIHKEAAKKSAKDYVGATPDNTAHVETMDIINGLRTWIDKTDSYYEGNRNQYVYKFAAALCNYGVSEEDAAGYISDQYDLKQDEIFTTVGSAYRKNEAGIKTFTKFKQNNPEAVFNPSTGAAETKKSAEAVTSFWHISDKGKVDIDGIKLFPFLEALGFRTYQPKGQVKDLHFVRVQNIVVKEVSVKEIKEVVLDYVINFPAPDPVINHIYKTVTLFTPNYLNALKRIEIDQIKDLENKSYVFFKTGYYEITAEGVSPEPKSYLDLEGGAGRYIWEDHLAQREAVKFYPDCSGSDYSKMMFNVLGQDETKHHNAQRVLGYLLHNYKDVTNAKLSYFSDDSIKELEGEADGGTGKNLVLDGLSLIRKVVTLEGELFDKGDRFAFQSVDEKTQIVLFDEFRQKITTLFAKVTGSWSMQKKGLQEIILPFNKSPKMCVASNYSQKDMSNSSMRRLVEIGASNFYGKGKREPKEDFGKLLDPVSWSGEKAIQWDLTYSFLFNCIQKYLKEGLPKTKANANTKQKQITGNTSPEFVEWFNANYTKLRAEKFYAREAVEVFHKEMDLPPAEVANRTFYRWLAVAAEVYGFTLKTNNSVGVQKTFTIIEKD